MEEEMCPFPGTCFFPSDACTKVRMADCSEAQKRIALTNKPCPLMTGKRVICDIPQLRVFVPSGAECHNGGNCRIRKIMPEIAGKVAGNNGTAGMSKISDDALKKAGKEIITAMEAKPTTVKVAI